MFATFKIFNYLIEIEKKKESNQARVVRRKKFFLELSARKKKKKKNIFVAEKTSRDGNIIFMLA